MLIQLCKESASHVHCWLSEIQLSHSHEPLAPTPAPCNLTFTQITAAIRASELAI